MARPCFWLASLALLLTLAPATAADEVQDLFDGKSLDGWVVEGPAKGKTGQTMWSVEDGRIVWSSARGSGSSDMTAGSSPTSPCESSTGLPRRREPTPRATAASVSGRDGSTPGDRAKPAPRTPPMRCSCSMTPAAGALHTGQDLSIGTRARPPTRRGRLPSGTRSRSSAPGPGSEAGLTATQSCKPTGPNSRM